MKVKLKVVQGKLKGKDGESAGLEVVISKARFVIGTARDCQMRCPSRVISPHHCEITVRNDEVRLRDLGSETGTFLNGEQITEDRVVQPGDQLRVGRLEFEFLIEQAVSIPKRDAVDDFVSDMLSQADDEERASRMADPNVRQFQIDKDSPSEIPSEASSEPEKEDKQAALRKKVPPKRPPGKLPPPPPLTAESSVLAAEQTLQKIFEKPKQTPPKR